ncbi:MAG: acetyltransferase [Pseudomonadales bacterium]|nr:acetyltransferase [Pseudomonadales bacterium]
MNQLAIVGASGHGKVVAETAELCGWQSIVFFDDGISGQKDHGNWPLSGDTLDLIKALVDYDGVIVAIGNNLNRAEKLNQLRLAGAELVTLIHPAACVSRSAKIGEGSVIFAGAIVNADVEVEAGVILNTGCSVDHDCYLGRAVHISPGAHLAGGVRVGDYSWIGIGANVLQEINVGAHAVVGAGAAVVSDVSDTTTVVGVPAHCIKS